MSSTAKQNGKVEKQSMGLQPSNLVTHQTWKRSSSIHDIKFEEPRGRIRIQTGRSALRSGVYRKQVVFAPCDVRRVGFFS
eukprot:1950061-Rhodomonas_salina.1